MVFRRILSNYRLIIDRLWAAALTLYIFYMLIAVPSSFSEADSTGNC